jgi:hypothetical protein
MIAYDNPGKNSIDPEFIRSLRNIVKATRDSIELPQVQGISANSSFGEISKFAAAGGFAKLLRKHNVLQDSYHLSMFEHLVNVSDILPARMFLLHALLAIIA